VIRVRGRSEAAARRRSAGEQFIVPSREAPRGSLHDRPRSEEDEMTNTMLAEAVFAADPEDGRCGHQSPTANDEVTAPLIGCDPVGYRCTAEHVEGHLVCSADRGIGVQDGTRRGGGVPGDEGVGSNRRAG